MGFYGTKPAFRVALEPVARRTSVVPADVWTWMAVGVAVLAGILLGISGRHPGLLLVVPGLLFLRLLLNVLDGVIAQQTRTASARGEALSEFSDRLSDVAILTGFALSGYGRFGWAVAATIVVLLVSYVGILGKAVGAGRQYGGLMGKPDRMVVLMIACLMQWVIAHHWFTWPRIAGAVITVFDLGSVVILLFGLYTVWVRLRAIFTSLAGKR